MRPPLTLGSVWNIYGLAGAAQVFYPQPRDQCMAQLLKAVSAALYTNPLNLWSVSQVRQLVPRAAPSVARVCRLH